MIQIKDSNVTINVKDMDASIAFYLSIGFGLKNKWGNHYAQLTAAGITIGLHPADNSSPISAGNVSLGFKTDRFEETELLLEKASVKTIHRKEEGGEFLHFNDPDGTALYFIKPKW